MQQQFAPNVAIRQGPMPFIRPPFEAIIFLPLAFFSYPVAFGIWTFAKIILLWVSLRVVPRPFPFTRIYPYWLEATLCLGFFPVFLDLFQGQDSILLLLIVALALNQLHSRKDAVAGAILALGLFKFHLLLPIAIILWLAGRPRILIGLLPGAAALVGISCALSGASVLSTYPAYLFRLNQTPGVGFVTVQSMPNLRGVLSAFVGRSPNPGHVQWVLFAGGDCGDRSYGSSFGGPVINRGFSGPCAGVLPDLAGRHPDQLLQPRLRHEFAGDPAISVGRVLRSTGGSTCAGEGATGHDQYRTAPAHLYSFVLGFDPAM